MTKLMNKFMLVALMAGIAMPHYSFSENEEKSSKKYQRVVHHVGGFVEGIISGLIGTCLATKLFVKKEIDRSFTVYFGKVFPTTSFFKPEEKISWLGKMLKYLRR